MLPTETYYGFIYHTNLQYLGTVPTYLPRYLSVVKQHKY